MITFLTCVPSKAALEETKVIYLCRTMWKSRTRGLSSSITFVLPVAAILFCSWSRFGLQEDKIRKKEDKRHSSQAVDPMNEPQEGEPCDVIKPRQVPCRTRWKVYQNALCWINLKSHDSVTERTSVSDDSFIASSATKSSSDECLASSNVQHEDHHQRGPGAG